MSEDELENANDIARSLEKRGIANGDSELLAAAWEIMKLVDYICEQEDLLQEDK